MATITGVVEGKFKNESGWWNIKVNGKRLDTKKTSIVNGLEKGMRITAEVEETQNGEYTNYLLQKWTPAAAETTPEETEYSESAGEKDRTIAMESALSSAGQYMQALAVANPTAVTAANWLTAGREAYKLIQRARRGADLSLDDKALKETLFAANAANGKADDEGLPF